MNKNSRNALALPSSQYEAIASTENLEPVDPEFLYETLFAAWMRGEKYDAIVESMRPVLNRKDFAIASNLLRQIIIDYVPSSEEIMNWATQLYDYWREGGEYEDILAIAQAERNPVFQQVAYLAAEKVSNGEFAYQPNQSEDGHVGNGEQPEADTLLQTLSDHNATSQLVGQVVGHSFTRYIVDPVRGTKVTQITKLGEDLRVALRLSIPPLFGRDSEGVAIDVPRKDREYAFFEDYLPTSRKFTFCIGVNLGGELIEADLSDSNSCHFLVGGTTGSGKSEFLISGLLGLVSRFTPDEVRLLIIDPKRVTFPAFEECRWLAAPLVKDVKGAIKEIGEAAREMERRYRIFEKTKTKNIDEYNELPDQETIPRLIIVIDEYADLVADKEARTRIEPTLSRLGAKSRACGIHLIIATQKPSIKVLDSVLRSNLPARVALKVPTVDDSKIILGSAGEAHNLLGKGDLYYRAGGSEVRSQSLFCSNPEKYLNPSNALALTFGQ